MNPQEIRFLAFDADDTLWVTEPYYQQALNELKNILQPYLNGRDIHTLVYQRERANLELFGYGAKGFTLSMIETACQVSENQVHPKDIQNVIAIGKNIVSRPMELLPDVRETLEELGHIHSLTLITKGDLLDQQRKLERSGLGHLFDRIEIVSEKNEAAYTNILHKHGIHPRHFIMVGDSMKSDVLPVVNIGGTAIHLPGPTTWVHEKVDTNLVNGDRFFTVDKIRDLPKLLNDWSNRSSS